MTFTAAPVMVSKSLTAATFPVVEFRQQMEPAVIILFILFIKKIKNQNEWSGVAARAKMIWLKRTRESHRDPHTRTNSLNDCDESSARSKCEKKSGEAT